MINLKSIKFFVFVLVFLACTTACTGQKPILTDGSSHMTLKSVVLGDTSSIETSNGSKISNPPQGFKILTLEFTTKDGGNIISYAFGKDLSGAIELFMPGGIGTVYATDQSGEKYYAAYINATYIVIPVPENSTALTLFVGSLDPIDITVK